MGGGALYAPPPPDGVILRPPSSARVNTSNGTTERFLFRYILHRERTKTGLSFNPISGRGGGVFLSTPQVFLKYLPNGLSYDPEIF